MDDELKKPRFENEKVKERRRFMLTCWAFAILSLVVAFAIVAALLPVSAAGATTRPAFTVTVDLNKWAFTLLTAAFGTLAGYALKSNKKD
jgi:FtsH-binding integral membrane protein